MQKYRGKQIFTHRRFPEVGQKQKTEKEKRPKVCNNNGQLHIATPPRVAYAKPPGPKRLNVGNNIGQLHIEKPPQVAHAKPPGPKSKGLN